MLTETKQRNASLVIPLISGKALWSIAETHENMRVMVLGKVYVAASSEFSNYPNDQLHFYFCYSNIASSIVCGAPEALGSREKTERALN